MITHPQPNSPLLTLVALSFGALGFVTVLVLVPFVISRLAPAVALRKEMHQTHKAPTPRLGGIALAGAFLLVAIATYWIEGPQPGRPRVVLGLSSLAMFGLGLWDDIHSLGAKKKLLGQILIAAAAFYFGLKVETFKNPLTGHIYELGPLSIGATVFWLVAMTNLINLIDGMDGLASGISLMLMCLLVYVGFHGKLSLLCIAMGMTGALVAFLYFNFPPARIFLGDGGAYFLGYLIGGLTIQNSNKGTIAAALIAPLFALALPILDVSFSIVRRGMKGLPIFRPDRRHIHHRLLQAGWSRRRAVLTLYGVSLLFLLLGFAVFWTEGRMTPILIGCGFVVLLIAAPSLGLIKNWLTVGSTLGSSIEMREQIQYALLMRNCLEIEAGRCESMDQLWESYIFSTRKLGFSEITLITGGQRCRWQTEAPVENPHSSRYEMQIGEQNLLLELQAPKTFSDQMFQLLSELSAETWQNIARRWAERHPGRLAPPSCAVAFAPEPAPAR